jgi:hypothetical protein
VEKGKLLEEQVKKPEKNDFFFAHIFEAPNSLFVYGPEFECEYGWVLNEV